MIHIGRAGSKLGSFSEFEIRQGLKSGKFFLTDLGWKEGMEKWAPLSDFDPSRPPVGPPG
jgi:GYF domain 2